MAWTGRCVYCGAVFRVGGGYWSHTHCPAKACWDQHFANYCALQVAFPDLAKRVRNTLAWFDLSPDAVRHLADHELLEMNGLGAVALRDFRRAVPASVGAIPNWVGEGVPDAA
jgi:hypothetical protein